MTNVGLSPSVGQSQHLDAGFFDDERHCRQTKRIATSKKILIELAALPIKLVPPSTITLPPLLTMALPDCKEKTNRTTKGCLWHVVHTIYDANFTVVQAWDWLLPESIEHIRLPSPLVTIPSQSLSNWTVVGKELILAERAIGYSLSSRGASV